MPALNSRVVGIIDVGTVGSLALGVDVKRFACNTDLASTANKAQHPSAMIPRFSIAGLGYAYDDRIIADVRQLSEDLKQEWMDLVAAN